MKKSIRILSLIMTIVLLMSSVSILGSAYTMTNGYAEYRNQNGTGLLFDDVNDPKYDVHQYASMALDAVDQMLAEEQISLDIYIGTLSLSSIDGTITSIQSIIDTASDLLGLGLLGDATDLVDALAVLDNTKRSNGDLTVIWDLLDLIGGLTPLVEKYCAGTISLGVLNALIEDYIFNVRDIIYALLISVADLEPYPEDYKDYLAYYMETKTLPTRFNSSQQDPAIGLLEEVIVSLLLGKWEKLDDLFYSETNKGSRIAYHEIEFRSGSASGAVVTDALDTAAYDYYGWVHENSWVTVGLGEFIRVAEGAAAPQASYQLLDLSTLNTQNVVVYEFVEPLLQRAYNCIAVPVLNRITKNWLREERGYTFDEKYTEEWLYDADGNPILDEEGNHVKNPDFDYLYGGEAPEVLLGDRIFEIIDVENLDVPKAVVPANSTFINELNKNAANVVFNVIEADAFLKGTTTPVTDVFQLNEGQIITFKWEGQSELTQGKAYEFDWTFGGNNYITGNIVNLLKFVVQVTEEDFFSKTLINLGEVYSPAQIQNLDNQQFVAYIIRSVINTNVPTMYIPDNTETQTVAGAAFEAVHQLAYQDLPEITYTAPVRANYPTYAAYADVVLNKALLILMDVAAVKLNSSLDTEYNTVTGQYNPKTNNGLLSILGDSGNYGTTVAKIGAWGVSNWASTANGTCLFNVDLVLDSQGGNYVGFNENTVFNDIDTLLNSIIPIKGTGAWISSAISTQPIVSKAFIFDYLVKPLLLLDFTNIIEIFSRNTSGEFATKTLERVLLDLVGRVVNLLFPNVWDNTVATINGLINTNILKELLCDLLTVLSATKTRGNVVGRGKVIAEIALPIVCMAIGLSDTQEFGELENYIPTIITNENTTTNFLIYNGCGGVNTSYRDPVTKNVIVDKLYTYKIASVSAKKVATGAAVNISGIARDTIIAAGKSVNCSLSGYTAGDTIQTTITYNVLDETGQQLNTKPLEKTVYSYVGSTDKGDDEIEYSKKVGEATVYYKTNIYVSGSVSNADNYTLKIDDRDDNTATNATIASVTATATSGGNNWILKNTQASNVSAAMTGQGGKYFLNPLEVSENAKRTEYNYLLDENNRTVYDEHNLPVKNGIKEITEEGKFYVPEGEYNVTIGLTIGGSSTTITVKVHVFNDYGLAGLVDRVESANYTNAGQDEAGKGRWNEFDSVFKAAISFVRQPHSHGDTFLTHIASPGPVVGEEGTYNCENRYEYNYRKLYALNEFMALHALGAGAASLRNTVNSYWPYNYTVQTGTFGTVTAPYKVEKEYYESIYSHLGMKNYVPHTYRDFKDAVNRMNNLIDKQIKYFPYNPEDFAELDEADQAKAIENYEKALEDIKPINSVEAEYANHMLQLTHSRLIPVAGNKTKLNLILNTPFFVVSKGASSEASWAKYQPALTFAQNTSADSTATAEQITTAMNKLIEMRKQLADGADYTALIAAVNAHKQYISDTYGGWCISGGDIIVEDAAQQTVHTVESLTAFLLLVEEGDRLLDEKDAGEDLSVADQPIIDELIVNMATAKDNLVPYGQGGDDDATIAINPNCVFSQGGIEFSPVLDEQILVDRQFYQIVETRPQYAEYDGIEITGAVYGVKLNATEAEILSMFESTGYDVTVVPNATGNYTTGAYVVATNTATGVVDACYFIVVRGDVDGDSAIASSDAMNITYALYQVVGYYWKFTSDPERYLFAAADITNDKSFDTGDKAGTAIVAYKISSVNQETGELI